MDRRGCGASTQPLDDAATAPGLPPRLAKTDGIAVVDKLPLGAGQETVTLTDVLWDRQLTFARDAHMASNGNTHCVGVADRKVRELVPRNAHHGSGVVSWTI